MSGEGRGNLINIIAILLAMIDKGIIETDEFVDYQMKAIEALAADEQDDETNP